jgi:hypothetical protein
VRRTGLWEWLRSVQIFNAILFRSSIPKNLYSMEVSAITDLEMLSPEDALAKCFENTSLSFHDFFNIQPPAGVILFLKFEFPFSFMIF